VAYAGDTNRALPNLGAGLWSIVNHNNAHYQFGGGGHGMSVGAGGTVTFMSSYNPFIAYAGATGTLYYNHYSMGNWG
jgi:hypothetical protein